MDELFEAMVLIQTGKIESFPVVLLGRDYWQPLVDFLKEMVSVGTIDTKDTNLLLFTDSVDEAMNHIEKYAVEKFGLVRRKMPRATRELGEKMIKQAGRPD